MKTTRIFKTILIATAVVAVLLFAWIVSLNKTSPHRLSHYYKDNVEEITDLTTEEQQKLLEVFQIIIPDTETEAYICSFQKVSQGQNICPYLIEFDNVKSYENFYKANIDRKISDNVIDNISLNQMYGAMEQDGVDDYYNVGDGDTEHYLTYGLLIIKNEENEISALFEEYSSERK